MNKSSVHDVFLVDEVVDYEAIVKLAKIVDGVMNVLFSTKKKQAIAIDEHFVGACVRMR